MFGRLPLRLRIQFALTRRLTAILRTAHLREPVIALREAARRAVRSSLERLGVRRLSHPALWDMDLQLDRLIDRDGGVFIEVGGADGYTQSNTYYLERFRGWRGLLVEPMPEMAALARRNRRHAVVEQCALVPFDHGDEHVEMRFGDLMTTVRGSRPDDETWTAGGLLLGWRDPRVERVPARPLSRVLDEHGIDRIDLFSLDVEGYESQVLRGLDLDRHAPEWILVEMHDLAAGRAQIEPLLGDRYEEHSLLSHCDVLYRRVTAAGAAG